MARKTFNCYHRSDKDIETLQRVHNTLQSPHIVRFLGFQTRLDKIRMYLELMRGSLQHFVDAGLPFAAHVPLLKYLAHSMVAGLMFLHSKLNIIHRDVRPDNILVGYDGSIKLCDFGISRELSQSRLCRSTTGCEIFLPPECFLNTPHNERLDVWMLGLTLMTLFKGSNPYLHFGKAPFEAIVHDTPPVLTATDTSDEAFRIFLAACLRWEMKERPSYTQPPQQACSDVIGLPLVQFTFVVEGASISKEAANAIFTTFRLPHDIP